MHQSPRTNLNCTLEPVAESTAGTSQMPAATQLLLKLGEKLIPTLPPKSSLSPSILNAVQIDVAMDAARTLVDQLPTAKVFDLLRKKLGKDLRKILPIKPAMDRLAAVASLDSNILKELSEGIASKIPKALVAELGALPIEHCVQAVYRARPKQKSLIDEETLFQALNNRMRRAVGDGSINLESSEVFQEFVNRRATRMRARALRSDRSRDDALQALAAVPGRLTDSSLLQKSSLFQSFDQIKDNAELAKRIILNSYSNDEKIPHRRERLLKATKLLEDKLADSHKRAELIAAYTKILLQQAYVDPNAAIKVCRQVMLSHSLPMRLLTQLTQAVTDISISEPFARSSLSKFLGQYIQKQIAPTATSVGPSKDGHKILERAAFDRSPIFPAHWLLMHGFEILEARKEDKGKIHSQGNSNRQTAIFEVEGDVRDKIFGQLKRAIECLGVARLQEQQKREKQEDKYEEQILKIHRQAVRLTIMINGIINNPELVDRLEQMLLQHQFRHVLERLPTPAEIISWARRDVKTMRASEDFRDSTNFTSPRMHRAKDGYAA